MVIKRAIIIMQVDISNPITEPDDPFFQSFRGIGIDMPDIQADCHPLILEGLFESVDQLYQGCDFLDGSCLGMVYPPENQPRK
jgi:hypothetical protein